jgi:hypothetical protein
VNGKSQSNGENPEYCLLRPLKVDHDAIEGKKEQKGVGEEASKTCPHTRTGSYTTPSA